MRRIVVLALGAMLVSSACASGPAPEVLAAGRTPSTTTTTLPPPEGVTVVRIANASFRPSNLTLDIDREWIVEWRNEDDREYQIISRDRNDEGERIFESPMLVEGDTWQVDFRDLEPAVYRYFMTLGAQSIPGLVDTRPEQ